MVRRVESLWLRSRTFIASLTVESVYELALASVREGTSLSAMGT